MTAGPLEVSLTRMCMKLRILSIFLAAMLAISCVYAGARPAAVKSITTLGYLNCGGARLAVGTVYLDVPDQDFQPLSQRITLQRPGTNGLVVLHHDGRPLRQSFLKNTWVLDAALSGWTCLTATDGKAYVYVSYVCTQSDSRPDCDGTSREWGRLFDPKGKELTAGFPHGGPSLSVLMKRLGLGRYENGPIQLQSIDDSANR
jgi:hypothetical protein